MKVSADVCHARRTQGEERGLEFGDYIRVVRKRWMLIVVAVLAGVAVGAVVSILTTARYEAKTLSFVSVQNSGTIQDFAQGATYTQNIIQSFVDAIRSPAVLDEVVADPNLGLDETASELAHDVDATVSRDSVNIEITVTRNDPAQAAAIADAVTASFRKQASELTRPGAGAASPVVVTILTPAEVPAKPVVPDTKLNLAVGVFIGLAVGLALALLIDRLDTRIRNEQDVSNVTDVPTLGGIVFDEQASKRPLIVHSLPSSPRSEAFRSLRTNLQFLDVEGGPRSFVVTSSVSGEGKSTTTANLAIAIAQSEARVLVIDGDLRDPSIATLFGIEGAVGLTDVLIGRAEASEAMQTWGLTNLTILPAGSVPPNPSELLGSEALRKLLLAAEQEFDFVLIDSPPLLPVTDAALLAKHVRGSLVIVAAGKTHRGQLTGALDALRNVDAHVAGLIITMLPTKGPEAYGYGRYGYGAQGYGREHPAAKASETPE